MPVPKGKISKARRDKRAATKGIKPKAVAVCQTCQAPVAPHQACLECGYYKGKKVLRTKTDRMYEGVQTRKEKEARMKQKGGESAAVPESSEETKSE